MKVKFFFSILFFFLILFLYPTSIRAQEALPGELLIKFKSSVPLIIRNQVLQTASLSIPIGRRPEIRIGSTKELTKLDVVSVYIPEDLRQMFMTILSKDQSVEFVEPNFRAQKASITNDPSLNDQWGLFTIQAAKGLAESAWDITQASNVRVAVLDTGIYKNHTDLSGKVILEKDFANTGSTLDNDGHGTHVAGTICADTNNATGGAGVGYNCVLLNGKVLDDSGYGTYSGIASGIVWASDNDAKVINLSLGGTADSATLKNAIDYAASKGVVVVAAAGNENTNAKLYPAAYPYVISVAAVDQNDQKPSWSNFGAWVDVSAPGVSILSTYKNGGYASYSGTSMATAVVSGVAALEWGTGNCATSTCVIDTVQTTADPISGTGTNWVWGRVNALAAVKKLFTITPSPTPSPSPTPTSAPTLTPTNIPVPTNTLTPTSVPTQSPTPSPTPTPTQTQQIMTVSAIDTTYSKFGTFRNISVKPTIISKVTFAPVPSAKVYLKLRSPSGKILTGSSTSGGNGVATITFWWLTEKGEYLATVDNVTKSSYSYNQTTSVKAFIVD